MQFHISREDRGLGAVAALELTLSVSKDSVLVVLLESIGAPLVSIVLLMKIIDSHG